MKKMLSLFFLAMLCTAPFTKGLSREQFDNLGRFAKSDPTNWDVDKAQRYLDQTIKALLTSKHYATASLKMYKKLLEKGIAGRTAQKAVIPPPALAQQAFPVGAPLPVAHLILEAPAPQPKARGRRRVPPPGGLPPIFHAPVPAAQPEPAPVPHPEAPAGPLPTAPLPPDVEAHAAALELLEE